MTNHPSIIGHQHVSAFQPNTGNFVFGSTDTNVRLPHFGIDLLGALEQNVRNAIDLLHEDDQVGYAVSLTVVPGETPGTFVPIMVLALTMAGVDKDFYSTNLSMDLCSTPEKVHDWVQELLVGMRADRDQGSDQGSLDPV